MPRTVHTLGLENVPSLDPECALHPHAVFQFYFSGQIRDEIYDSSPADEYKAGRRAHTTVMPWTALLPSHTLAVMLCCLPQ